MPVSNPNFAYPAINRELPSEIDSYMYITCRKYAGTAQARGNPSAIPVYALIRLPLPQDLARSTGNNYEPEDSTKSYNASKTATASASQGGESLGILNRAGSAMDRNGGFTPAGFFAGGMSLVTDAMSPVQTLIKQGAKIAINTVADQTSELTSSRRNMMSQEMTWKSTTQRDFTFKWSLVPRGRADVTAISNISSAFEAYSLGQKDILSPLSRVLAPFMWTIECKRDNGLDITEQTIGSPKLCGISDVSVVNDTKSMAEDDEGNIYPMKTELVVKFTEIEPILFNASQTDGGANPRAGIQTRSEAFQS